VHKKGLSINSSTISASKDSDRNENIHRHMASLPPEKGKGRNMIQIEEHVQCTAMVFRNNRPPYNRTKGCSSYFDRSSVVYVGRAGDEIAPDKPRFREHQRQQNAMNPLPCFCNVANIVAVAVTCTALAFSPPCRLACLHFSDSCLPVTVSYVHCLSALAFSPPCRLACLHFSDSCLPRFFIFIDLLLLLALPLKCPLLALSYSLLILPLPLACTLPLA
jgi:hypothetical protein